MNSRFSFTGRKDGSAFITVILFTFLLTTLIASVIGWSRNERLLTVRNAHWLESRAAAEAIAEYAFAQIEADFNGHSSPPTFDPAAGTTTSNFPVVLPPTAFWDSTGHVITSTTGSTSMVAVAGPPTQIPTSGFYYVDPNVPNNATDPLKGQWIQRDDVTVLARASVASPEGGPPLTTYISETISVRGAPLFANAIFYSNVDLEIFPGPTMTITGPVRTNGNMFVSSQGSSLTFQGPVSMSGNLYHAWSNSNVASEGSGSETLGSSPVYFANSAGTSTSLYQTVGSLNGTSYGTVWVDSTMGQDAGTAGLSNLQALVTNQRTTDFRQEATQIWGGNLQTGAMGVQVNSPISFNQVIDSAGDTPDPHSIIDPPATSTYLNADSNYTAAKQSVEENKFSTQAGLYILVTITNTSDNSQPPSATINLYGPGSLAPNVKNGSVTSEGDTSTSNAGPNGGPLLGSYTTTFTSTGSMVAASTPNGMVVWSPYISTTSGSVTTTNTTYTSTTTTHSYKQTTTTTTVNANRNNYSSGVGSVTATSTVTSTTTTSTTVTGSSQPGNTTTSTQNMSSATNSSTNTVITSGMYDQRRQMGIDLVQIDMSVLTAAINDMINGTSSNGKAITYTSGGNTYIWGAQPSGNSSTSGNTSTTPWNGGIYIDVEAPNSETSTQSASIILINGSVSSGNSLAPSFGSNGNGLTVATNAPVYVKGPYNADGSLSSGTPATTPDDGKTDSSSSNMSAESPACIAADAITLLSTNFSLTNTLTVKPSSTADDEVAAALLTGIEPTSNSASSGGAHNLPRFLESWGNTVAIRGSLTCLYQSKVGVQPWSTAYYGAPTRKWGFDVQFQNGHFPPLVPKVMSYRRVSFNDISSAQYTSLAHSFYPSEF